MQLGNRRRAVLGGKASWRWFTGKSGEAFRKKTLCAVTFLGTLQNLTMESEDWRHWWFWTLVVGEAPGQTVEPILCPEGSVFLPSATCHTFLVSWHLCAQHTIQMSACGLFSCGRNVLRVQTACQAAFSILVLNLFVKHSHPSPLPSRQMLSGCICWGWWSSAFRWLVQVTSPAEKQSPSYWLHQAQ